MLGVLFMTGNLFATELKSVLPSAGDGLVIDLKITFHRPKFDCQRGFGICLAVSATWNDSGNSGGNDFCYVKASVNERNQLIVEISEAALAKYEGGSSLPYFKDKTTIPILDPYTLPEETCRVLGVKPPQTIKPGNYPVTYQDGVYTVIFQL